MLRVRVLGGLAVEGVEPAQLGSRKQRRLLGQLALAGGVAVSVDALVEDLWGAQPPANPREQLAVLVSRLRSALDGQIVRSDAGYALTAGWCDLPAFHERREVACTRAATQQWAAAAEAGRAALALLRGPLLPELAEAENVVIAQVALDRGAQEVRRVLALAEIESGDPRRAVDLAHAALVLSPYDEVALRLHLRACLLARSPALGLATYAQTCERLAEDLGVDPAPESRAAHALLLSATREQPQRPRSAPPAPPGRAAQVEEATRLLATGSGGLLVFTGEPGIGKTRVLQAVRDAADCLLLTARCEQLSRVLPLQPVLDAVGAALRGRASDEVATLLAEDSGLLGPVLGLRATATRTALPDGGLGPLLLQAAVLRLMDRLAQGGPVLLTLDDAHFADAATVALLVGLPSQSSRLVAVVAARSGTGPPWPDEVVREVGPLDLQAVTQWVGTEQATALHARSGGHPLLLQELLAHEGEDVPASLSAAFAAAADAAGTAGSTLRAASVVGLDLDLDVLAAVLGTRATEVLDDLEEGVRRRLLVENSSGFAFRHQLVQEALAASIGPTRVALLHRETARALEARTDADPLVVAHHARAGGLDDLTADALVRAGEVVASRFAHLDSLVLADQALGLRPSHPAALLLRARALLVLTRYDDAAHAADLAVDAGAGAVALQVGALADHYARRWERAAALADQAAATATESDLRASSLAVAAHALHAAGDLSGAEIRWAAAGEDTGSLAHAPSGWLALLRHHQGRSQDVVRLTESQRVAHGLDQLALPLLQMSRGLSLAALGRSAQALTCFDATQELVDTLDLRRYLGRADNCRGYVLRNLAEFSHADDLNAAGRESGVAIGMDEPIAHALLDLTEGRLRAGDLAGAQDLLDQAAVFASQERRHGFQWRHRVRAQWLRGRLLLAASDLDGAAECAGAVVAAAARELPRYTTLGALLGMHVRLVAGDPPEAPDAARVAAALDEVAALEQTWLVADCLQAATGDVRDALLDVARGSADRLLRGAPDRYLPSLRSRLAVLLD